MTHSFLPGSRAFIISSAVYALISLALLISMNSDCYTVGMSCFETCGHGCEVALGVYKMGAFVDITAPEHLYTEWPIGFGLLAYLSLLLTSATSALPLLVLQLIMLYLMGVIAAKLTERLMPGWGWVAFLFVVLNPNALGLAITLKTDLVFAFVLSWAFLFLVNYTETWNWRWVAWTGIILGLATHVRPTVQFLILLLPIICLLIAVVAQAGSRPLRSILHGLTGLLLGVAVVLPWSLYMYSQGEGTRLYSSREELSVVTSHVNILAAQRDGKSLIDSRVENFELASEELVRKDYPDWEEFSDLEKRHKRISYAYDLLTSFEFSTYLKAGAVSAVGFFLSGGEGYLMQALQIADAEDGLDEEEASRVLALKILTRGFTLITRVLGLIGLWWLVANRHYMFLTLCIGSIAYFVVIHGFAGWSRFRIGVEIPLLVLTTIGVGYLAALFQNWKRTH
jgi:hypothetical protein